MTRQIKVLIFLSLGLSLATTVSFNPVNIAPTNIHLAMKDNKHSALANVLNNRRVLVLENTITAMFLLASGVPVANGIFYYPQKALWSRLDPDGAEIKIYNRYQHLTYLADPAPSKDYTLGTPRPDVVTVTVNLETFNFQQSGADIVTTADTHRNALDRNASLSFILSVDGWSWYKVNVF